MPKSGDVYPSITDDDLWQAVQADIAEHHGDRYTVEEVRRAFEIVCDKLDDYLPQPRFLKKVRVELVWNRSIDLDA